jgi:MFS family permease
MVWEYSIGMCEFASESRKPLTRDKQSYFFPAVLDTAGYHDEVVQTNFQLGYNCFQFFFALLGARFVDKIGRRPLMLSGMFGCAVIWIAVSTSTGVFAASNSEDGNAARATIAFIFLFGAVYSFNITPLQALYPVEVLSFEMRAKGQV